MEGNPRQNSPEPKNKARPGGKPERATVLGLHDADDSDGSLSPDNYGAPPDNSRAEGLCKAWLAAIRDDPAIRPTVFRTAHILALHMTPGGEASPPLKPLARAASRTERSLYSHLLSLRSAGYLTRVDGTGIGKPHVYLMQFPNGEVS